MNQDPNGILCAKHNVRSVYADRCFVCIHEEKTEQETLIQNRIDLALQGQRKYAADLREELERTQARLEEVENVALYCRDILNLEREHCGHNWTLALEVLGKLLGSEPRHADISALLEAR